MLGNICYTWFPWFSGLLPKSLVHYLVKSRIIREQLPAYLDYGGGTLLRPYYTAKRTSKIYSQLNAYSEKWNFVIHILYFSTLLKKECHLINGNITEYLSGFVFFNSVMIKVYRYLYKDFEILHNKSVISYSRFQTDLILKSSTFHFVE